MSDAPQSVDRLTVPSTSLAPGSATPGQQTQAAISPISVTAAAVRTGPERIANDAAPVLTVLRRAALPILVAGALAGGGGFLLANSQPRVYQAPSGLIASQSAGSGAITDNLVRPAPLPDGALAQALRSPRVIGTIVSELRASSLKPAAVDGLNRALRADLSSGATSRLSVTAAGSGQPASVYVLQARADTPEAARLLADASVTALQRWDAQRARARLEQARLSLRRQLVVLGEPAQNGLYDVQARTEAKNRLLQELGLLGALNVGVTGTLDVLSEAVAPSGPVAPQPLRSALLAALLAVLSAAGLAVLIDSLRRRS
jgi:uncharacterized protein involved in exopolysaccharide biosynthesis